MKVPVAADCAPQRVCCTIATGRNGHYETLTSGSFQAIPILSDPTSAYRSSTFMSSAKAITRVLMWPYRRMTKRIIRTGQKWSRVAPCGFDDLDAAVDDRLAVLVAGYRVNRRQDCQVNAQRLVGSVLAALDLLGEVLGRRLSSHRTDGMLDPERLCELSFEHVVARCDEVADATVIQRKVALA